VVVCVGVCVWVCLCVGGGGGWLGGFLDTEWVQGGFCVPTITCRKREVGL